MRKPRAPQLFAKRYQTWHIVAEDGRALCNSRLALLGDLIVKTTEKLETEREVQMLCKMCADKARYIKLSGLPPRARELTPTETRLMRNEPVNTYHCPYCKRGWPAHRQVPDHCPHCHMPFHQPENSP